ncbi:hypothetical protein P153DRAFT_363030 [Dothidotthia symphoricarpi CBS 119687]|uniref:Uncharacterized protein n=1 Tax=Dothidotthia symphoricarpi CBS 119687 TaxID=1392245 RepID=A0A6A6AR40_9PLEO|nr:uncharacterized protein P153DRAFT_363030 [Dothidotthia symphoricarpi CBS 119687]KAF2134006.1 hypothetical protein P153DRAFT_363030 [Dothidotthia symphoricarpi CBS 119687]
MPKKTKPKEGNSKDAEPKKPKPSEEAIASLRQRYHQARDAQLRQWYADSQSTDSKVSTPAQIRLQTQMQLREHRKQFATLRRQRKNCKRREDAIGLSDLQEESKRANSAYASSMRLLKGKTTLLKPERVLGRWMTNPPTLQEVLDDINLDKMHDFGAFKVDQNLLTPHQENDEVIPEYKEDDDWVASVSKMNLHDTDQGQNKYQKNTAFLERPLYASQEEVSQDEQEEVKSIWMKHEARMVRRFEATMSESDVQTMLINQKQAFDQHHHYEHLVIEEHERTKNLTAANIVMFNNRYIRTCVNPTLELMCHNQGTWDIVSTKLWDYLDGSKSWISQDWILGGQMCIETFSDLPRVHVTFGTRTFSTDCVQLPTLVDPQPFALRAFCEQDGSNVLFSITFLTSGFLKVQFPALSIIQPDGGSKVVPTAETVLELVGVYTGMHG